VLIPILFICNVVDCEIKDKRDGFLTYPVDPITLTSREDTDSVVAAELAEDSSNFFPCIQRLVIPESSYLRKIESKFISQYSGRHSVS